MTEKVPVAVMEPGAIAAMAANIAIIGGRADDPLFANIKKGLDDATRAVSPHSGRVHFLRLQDHDNIDGDAANLVRVAISQGVDVIAVPDWVPSSEHMAELEAEIESYMATHEGHAPLMAG